MTFFRDFEIDLRIVGEITFDDDGREMDVVRATITHAGKTHIAPPWLLQMIASDTRDDNREHAREAAEWGRQAAE